MEVKYREKEGRGGRERKEMIIYRHSECRIKSTEWIGQVGRQDKEREITEDALSDGGNHGGTFFPPETDRHLAQHMTTMDWKEAFDSSPGSLSWTSYLTSQAPFLQLCKMGALRGNELNAGPMSCQGNSE